MPDVGTFLLFAAASAALIVVPGPSVVFIVTRSLEHGRRAGLVSALGVQAGGLVHVAFATAGLSALLASSSSAFAVVKYAGAAYLVVLGLSRLRDPGFVPDGAVAAQPRPHARLFRQGVVVNVLNPKTAIFFLAFLPQFADRDAGPGAPQLLVLGLLFLAIATISDGTYALLAGALGDRLRRSARVRARIGRASGAIYVALGGVAALTGERR